MDKTNVKSNVINTSEDNDEERDGVHGLSEQPKFKINSNNVNQVDESQDTITDFYYEENISNDRNNKPKKTSKLFAKLKTLLKGFEDDYDKDDDITDKIDNGMTEDKKALFKKSIKKVPLTIAKQSILNKSSNNKVSIFDSVNSKNLLSEINSSPFRIKSKSIFRENDDESPSSRKLQTQKYNEFVKNFGSKLVKKMVKRESGKGLFASIENINGSHKSNGNGSIINNNR